MSTDTWPKLESKPDIARQFQERLMPAPPPSCAGLECFTYCGRNRPDGSFFDFFRSNPGEIATVIGNVNSRGIAGSILVTGVQAALRCMVRGGIELRHAVKEVNRLFWEAGPERVYGTLLSARVNPWGHQLRYINAGHHTAMIVRQHARQDQTIRYLEPNAAPLALRYGSSYRESSIPFNPGDIFITASEDIDRDAIFRAIADTRVRDWPAEIGEASRRGSARIVIIISWRHPEHNRALELDHAPVELVSTTAA